MRGRVRLDGAEIVGDRSTEAAQSELPEEQERLTLAQEYLRFASSFP